ncbi:hypothetical protein [Streptosporangium sp. V21-05]|uniref:hypothetical protein n=1 Tax=Streptosporangium sp. V21-05 TaxID=3446115 RepID=UPI003F5399FB
MRIFWIELRRSPFLWVFIPMGILALVVLLRERASWESVWPEASVQVIVAATQLPGVAIAAVAAWSAQRVHRGNAEDLLDTAARPRWQIEAMHLLSTLTYAWIPLAGSSVVAVFVTSQVAPPGFLWTSYLALGVVAVLISAALGHALGSVVKNRLAAPVAAFLSFFPLFIMSLLVPYFGEANKEVSPLALTVRLTFALACVAAALTLGAQAAWRRHVAWKRLASGAAVAVTAAALIVVGPSQHNREPPGNPACGKVVDTQVCLWPENAARLPDAIQATSEVITATKGVLSFPGLVSEEGLGIATSDSQIEISVLPGITREAFRSLQIFRLTWTLVANCGAYESERDGRPRIQARAKMDTWLGSVMLGRLQDAEWDSFALTPSSRKEVEVTLNLPRYRQEEWARKQVLVMGICND